ncbi:MAG: YihY/virulence factor BrkB family protein [Acetobacteraceae bacterium]|nr:YihY/virulence factor BrkB family protein [Acetobacteraceae bacterium]MSP29642.1 YihY/virulence factor BrkB family protein [Acetobacteraceae bacterium]
MTDPVSPNSRPFWHAILRATLREMVTDQASLVAAGCAFYATLALFPAITMLIFVYGLAFDPVTVEPQLKLIEKLLPPEAFSLIAGRVHVLVSQPRGNLGTGLAISIAIAFWSASAGTRAMLSALNLAFGVTDDRRGLIGFYATGFLMTFCTILATATGIALLVFLPALLAFLGATADITDFVRWLSLALLLGFVLVSLTLLYRFGPAKSTPGPWLSQGALLATALWLAASLALSLYVERVATYDATYGPLGAVVAIMMWFYVSAYVILLGAELDAQIARRGT